jgi:hypothetical protein
MMKREDGCPKSPVWLLGDSPPKHKHADWLNVPLDARFPTRNNIWTPIETVINRELFRHKRSRIDDSKFYVRNAVPSADLWKRENKLELDEEVLKFRQLIEVRPPFLILTFGQRALEFTLRAQNVSDVSRKEKPFSDWDLTEIQKQFDEHLPNVQVSEVNVLPLLHAIIARQFKTCHEHFSNNYYEYVGVRLATIFMKHLDDPRLSKLMDVTSCQ